MLNRNKHLLAMSFLAAGLLSSAANATIVELQTNQGNIKINLFDQTTPATVANFLSYVNKDAFDETVFHRAVKGFVLQGGGFIYDGKLPLSPVATDAAVINEPKHSNVKGTIAMAKLGGNPNSATNQWFINLANNSANLDVQNGGFTVFGQVVEGDMAVVEGIMNLTICREAPLINYTAAQCTANTDIAGENFVKIMNVNILDTDPASATNAGIVPVENTLIKAAPADKSDSSSGSLSALLLGLIGFVGMRRLK
ncbi:peptidylprolyl isomerase [Pseudoalteromonas tunicata]|uniref:peptidylprolyl isomerase n=1 Tax=Pseudoalteromonas tunicata TaxID=314281 RepID=UPI00273FC5B3|nr:peptidylprolyl isomerase [Pseudoalteromonas tunicata]MDP4983948.1 peptidylprolyl isomerase [Pseudoalteromonas tunicata]